DWGVLEVGPGSTLTQFAKLHPACGLERLVVPSLPHPQEQQPSDAFFFTTLGKLWLAGVEIDWAALYRQEQRRRVVLPTYPWQRQRYWIEPGAAPAAATAALERQPDLGDWFYLPTWQESAPPSAQLDASQRWLIFADRCGIGAALAERLELHEQDVIIVEANTQFAQTGEQAYTLSPGRREDYQSLISSLRERELLPQRIVHAWTIADDRQSLSAAERLAAAEERGFYSLLWLAQALGEITLDEQIHMTVLANGTHEVESGDEVRPEQALVLGPCKVIPLEYEALTCRSIDIQLPKAASRPAKQLIEQLIHELAAPNAEQIVAYRGRHRWTRTYTRAPLSTPTRIERLRERGVYVITGGLGGMSLKLGQYLAETVQARLVLVSRSGLPPRETWDERLATQSDDRISQQMRAVQAIEAAGGEVLIISADVTDPEAMRAVKAQALERFGAIHGLIHAAGVGGGGLIQLKTRAAAEEVIAPKARGLLALQAITDDLDLDFFAIFSSLASILGALGRVDYCAANAFVDAFAYRHSALSGTDTFTINWQTWQATGMSVNTIVPEELSELRELMIEDGLQPDEGVEVFRRALAHNRQPQIAISTIDLQARVASVAEVSRARREAALEPDRQAKPAHARPDLATAYVAPSSATEQAVAAIWQELLGIDQIGVNDNFFELGGHSLLATQIVFRIRDTLQIELTLGSFFETPTVAGVAAVIARRQAAPEDDESIPLPVLVPQPESWHEPFPLTDMQQAYWVGRSGAFDMGNVSIHLYLEIESDTLDVARFNRAWQLLVQRHDMLRAIIQPDGQQRILEHVPDYEIGVLDLRGRQPEQVAAQLSAIREELSHQVLPTDQWPLFDVRATLLDDERVRLHLSVDGIFADGRSYQILSHDLIELYENHEAFPQPFTISFRDYVLALRTFEESEAFQRSLGYWRDRLPTLPPAPELPLAAAPGSIAQPHFVRRSATLEPEIWQSLKTRTGQRGLTPTGLLLAVYAEV
ncbi:MAG TPA: SDR family NAD(P)-dependent oxidoreductase, partial [Herpetosiphonaceae bacterium]